MDFEGKHVLVVGMARSGLAAAIGLSKLGAEVTVVDSSKSPILKKRARELERSGIATKLGEHTPQDLEGKELVVVSPGVPDNIPFLHHARRRKIPIWSEVELAYHLTNIPIVGITGTNGKTTTAILVGKIFEQANLPHIVAGNIGFPLVESIEKAEPNSTLVVELSSFQLKNILDFRPHISVLLNITEDHLDWHMNFQEYIQAKARIFLNQTKDDFAVVNYDDLIVQEIIPSVKAKVIPFSKHKKGKGGIYVEDGKVIAHLEERQEIVKIGELKVKGEHNIDNVMAGVAVTMLCGVPEAYVRKAIISFKGLAHRLEFVKEVEGVAFYNDSKATNPDATIKALTAFEMPVILLLGGRNKGNSFISLVEEAEARDIKRVFVFGEAKAEIASLFKGSRVPVTYASSVEEAVRMAYESSSRGDVVLFSPACASFDMFANFEERGRAFKAAVLNLAQQGRCSSLRE